MRFGRIAQRSCESPPTPHAATASGATGSNSKTGATGPSLSLDGVDSEELKRFRDAIVRYWKEHKAASGATGATGTTGATGAASGATGAATGPAASVSVGNVKTAEKRLFDTLHEHDEETKKAFGDMDVRHDGRITVKEFHKFLSKQGVTISVREAGAVMLHSFDDAMKGYFTIDDFGNFFKSAQIEDMRFEMYEKQRYNSYMKLLEATDATDSNNKDSKDSATGGATASSSGATGVSGASGLSGLTGTERMVEEERLRRKGIRATGPTGAATGGTGASGSTGASTGPKKPSAGHWKWILNSHGGYRHHRSDAFKKFGLIHDTNVTVAEK